MVHRLDRLSRRVADCATLLNEFKEAGVLLMLAAMPEMIGGAFDELLLNLLSYFAEFEREMITSRIADTRAGMIAQNRRIAGRVPFGYSSDSRTKQLMPVAAEAVVVREFFRLIEKRRSSVGGRKDCCGPRVGYSERTLVDRTPGARYGVESCLPWPLPHLAEPNS